MCEAIQLDYTVWTRSTWVKYPITQERPLRCSPGKMLNDSFWTPQIKMFLWSSLLAASLSVCEWEWRQSYCYFIFLHPCLRTAWHQYHHMKGTVWGIIIRSTLMWHTLLYYGRFSQKCERQISNIALMNQFVKSVYILLRHTSARTVEYIHGMTGCANLWLMAHRNRWEKCWYHGTVPSDIAYTC